MKRKNMSGQITAELRESAALKEWAARNLVAEIQKAVREITAAFRRGRKVILFGNGGSAADAQHIAAELVGRFMLERRPLPAIALSTNSSVVTAIGNDYGFETVFSRQIAGLAEKGDVAVGISTTGNSLNVIEGIKTAKKIGCRTIGFSGGNGGKMKNLTDVKFCIPSGKSPRIQEAHITIGHIICAMVEKELFGR